MLLRSIAPNLTEDIREALLDGNVLSVVRTKNGRGEWEQVVMRAKDAQSLGQTPDPNASSAFLMEGPALEMDEDSLTRMRKVTGMGMSVEYDYNHMP